MSYTNIPKEFFMKACIRVQYSLNRQPNSICFDLGNRFILRDGELSNDQYAMFGCSNFNVENKDIVDFCYECFRQQNANCFYPEGRYGFDGEHITINTQLHAKCLDSKLV